MDFIEETAATSVKGSFVLFIGSYISLVINAIGVIIVARLLSPSEYGIFTVIMVLPNFLSLFTNWGTNSALINLIARNKSQYKSNNLRSLIKTGYVFNILIGGILTLFLFFSTEALSTIMLQRPEISNYVKIASIYIISITLHSLALSILSGFERMTDRSLLNIIQSLMKGVLSPLLVYLGYGVLGVVLGHIISYLVGATIGVLAVIWTIKNLPPEKERTNYLQNLKIILGYGLPIYFGNILAGLANQFSGLLLTWFIADEIIGNYNVALQLTGLIGVVTASLGITFFPAFSKYDVNQEPKKTRDLYLGSIRYSSIFLIPLASLLIILSKHIVNILFGSKYPYAPLYLSLLLIPSLLVGIGSLSFMQFLNSQGETRATMIVLSMGSLLKIVLSLLLIRRWGVVGLLTSFIVSDTIKNIIGLVIVGTKFKIKPDLNHMTRTCICSAISGGISLGLQMLIPIQQPLLTLAYNTSAFIASFLLFAPFIGVLEKKDIQNLETMLKNLPLVYPFARIILNFEGKLLELRETAISA